MKAWVLAGVFSALGAPMASAATTDCDGEELRPTVVAEQRQSGGAAPVSLERAEAAVARPAPPPRQAPTRRRSGKHIPDAELIGVYGTL